MQALSLLTQEPAPVTPDAAARTARFLLPRLAILESFFLGVRAEVDTDLAGHLTSPSGKPYPLGCCREITLCALEKLRARIAASGCEASRALADFIRDGGELRCVWGILRDRYFQTALQLDGLYVDVANDTVTVTKPKVEILPMEESGMAAVQDAAHFARIAEAYWGLRIYANTALPSLAPLLPMIGAAPGQRPGLLSATVYMVGLFCRDRFRSAEAWLCSAPEPPPEIVADLQRRHGLEPGDTASGRQAAVEACRSYRASDCAFDTVWITGFLERLAGKTTTEEATMTPKPSIVTIDGHPYDLTTLSEEARTQLAGLQAADQEIARLKTRLAIAQTARAAYATALKAELEKSPRL
ncbi:DUF6447 family protein [Rhodospirillum centenum]|uniref:Uncharacterized protein n=1 Tax=Rhodospirillum centenum (strain ATCC 51521 / SW) TaxID=414684 RepID=B6IXS0_RHOCS|nr:DUF6447 family protein [Rhodospirillum centenum]ACJ01094.1 hypothetical protein RC1_3751 [Rhodospirillum centenum SW]